MTKIQNALKFCIFTTLLGSIDALFATGSSQKDISSINGDPQHEMSNVEATESVQNDLSLAPYFVKTSIRPIPLDKHVFISQKFDEGYPHFKNIEIPKRVEDFNEKSFELMSGFVSFKDIFNDCVDKDNKLVNQYEARKHKNQIKFGTEVKATALKQWQIKAIKGYMEKANFSEADNEGNIYSKALKLGVHNVKMKNIWGPFANSNPDVITPALKEAGFIVFEYYKDFYISLPEYKSTPDNKKTYETRAWEEYNFKGTGQGSEMNKQQDTHK